MDLQLAAGVDLPQTAVRVYVCVVLVRSQLRCGWDWAFFYTDRDWALFGSVVCSPCKWKDIEHYNRHQYMLVRFLSAVHEKKIGHSNSHQEVYDPVFVLFWGTRFDSCLFEFCRFTGNPYFLVQNIEHFNKHDWCLSQRFSVLQIFYHIFYSFITTTRFYWLEQVSVVLEVLG